MAESPENKNSENTLFMRLSAVFLTIRGNKKEKNQKKLKNGVDKYQTGAIIIKSPRARATKTAHSGNEIKQINNGL